MAIALILAFLLALSSRNARQKQELDVEKGEGDDDEGQDHRAPREGVGSDAAEDGYGSDEDDAAPGASNANPRRFRRFSTIASFSKPFSRTSTIDTSVSTNSTLFSRLKAFLFPPEDPEALERFVPHYRYTPIISGIVIPFSILLEIPGLTEHWYIRTEGNDTVETKPNPAILDVGLGISMACALIANICLIIRFLEKRVKLMTLSCIVFLTLHDLINIITVTTFGVEHRFNDGFTYGQAYWMTVCSTVVSSITNISLIVDYCRTPDFATSGSGLTRKQRSLVVIVMTLLVYTAFGALCNSLIMDLTFINGLYFTTVTIETIGFGDITPNTTGARVFVCSYMVFGIINVGLVVGMCRETVLEAMEVSYRRRIQKMRMRRKEAKRFRMWETRWRKAVEWRLKERGLPVWIHDKHTPHEGIRFVGLSGPQGSVEEHWFKKTLQKIGLRKVKEEDQPHVRGHPRGKHLNIDALSNQQLEAAALEAGVPLELFTVSGHRRSTMNSHPNGSHHPTDRKHSHPTAESGLHRTSSANGWPSHPQTPTHAQVGRMAAMITKFAVAAAGTHIRMLGHAPQENEESEIQFQEHAEIVPPPPKRRGSSVWFWGHGHGPTDDKGGDAHEDIHQGRACESPIGFHEGEDENKEHQNMTSDQPVVEPQSQAPPDWARELARGVDQRSAVSYEVLKEDMESEERRAYLAKFTIAWSLFLIFWTIGSAIFSLTEGWTYGNAMYFCFTAFTTCGYGDFHPDTPAGRSVFVVWALLGVATMTILISVLQEAGSSRYKKALHSRMFDNAVKKYRDRQNEEVKQVTRERLHSVSHNRLIANLSQGSHYSMPMYGVDPSALDLARETARHSLEELPTEILRQARNIREHMEFYVKHGQVGYETKVMPGEKSKTRVPRELKSLLNEIGNLEGMNDKAKRDILQDEDSRRVLFMLSIERTLRGMIETAERSLTALAERDNLEALQRRQRVRPRFVGDSTPDFMTPNTRDDSGQVSDVESDESPETPEDIEIQPPSTLQDPPRIDPSSSSS